MPNLGRYCKAYPVKRLRKFGDWVENIENLRTSRTAVIANDGAEKRELAEDDYLYLQEDFKVTDGIFIDQNVIFDRVTPEWKEFCATELKFEAPQFD